MPAVFFFCDDVNFSINFPVVIGESAAHYKYLDVVYVSYNSESVNFMHIVGSQPHSSVLEMF